MSKLIHSFNIKIASKNKVKRESNTFTKVGKKCNAVVVKDDNKLKVRLITSPVKDNLDFNELIILPLTPNSLSLKGKVDVFLKNKDKYGHYVHIIRDILKSKISPGLNFQYDVLKEGLVISGNVVKQDDKHYFDYKELLAYNEKAPYINKPILFGINE